MLERMAAWGITHREDLDSLRNPMPERLRRKATMADKMPTRPGAYVFRDIQGRIGAFVADAGGPELVINSSPCYLNISLAGVDKGSTLHLLLDELGEAVPRLGMILNGGVRPGTRRPLGTSCFPYPRPAFNGD